MYDKTFIKFQKPPQLQKLIELVKFKLCFTYPYSLEHICTFSTSWVTYLVPLREGQAESSIGEFWGAQIAVSACFLLVKMADANGA